MLVNMKAKIRSSEEANKVMRIQELLERFNITELKVRRQTKSFGSRSVRPFALKTRSGYGLIADFNLGSDMDFDDLLSKIANLLEVK